MQCKSSKKNTARRAYRRCFPQQKVAAGPGRKTNGKDTEDEKHDSFILKGPLKIDLEEH